MADIQAAWAGFEAAAAAAAQTRIEQQFAIDPLRLERFTLDAAGLHLDLSKQPWDGAALQAGLDLVSAAGVELARDRLFGGGAINASEGRAVLHPALRAPEGAVYSAQGQPVSTDVEEGRRRMAAFAAAVRSGALRGATGESFAAVVHIGIGGSDLGPRLVWEALRPLDHAIDLRFAANVDGSDIAAVLHGLHPARTLVIAVSKTFTTQETLANLSAASDWLAAALGDGAGRHLAAVSAAPERTARFGIAPDRVFAFRDWVGGRFSVWSAVGLSCAVALGWEAFRQFLDGAAAMDDHFTSTPPQRNAPVLLALAHVLNRNGLSRGARAVIPYAQRLRLLPAFLQQLEMESNGKRVDSDGRPVRHATASAVFGEPGTNAQHAFFQLLHQGTDVIPVDFIGVAENDEGPAGAHAKLLSNLLAQMEALMVGRSEADVRHELVAKGAASGRIDQLAPQRAFPGDRPSTLILLSRLTPRALGALIALYEHKTFVEGVLWGVNSFDQWGVELGKALASRILPELQGGERRVHDPSTTALIARLAG